MTDASLSPATRRRMRKYASLGWLLSWKRGGEMRYRVINETAT